MPSPTTGERFYCRAGLALGLMAAGIIRLAYNPSAWLYVFGGLIVLFLALVWDAQDRSRDREKPPQG